MCGPSSARISAPREKEQTIPSPQNRQNVCRAAASYPAGQKTAHFPLRHPNHTRGHMRPGSWPRSRRHALRTSEPAPEARRAPAGPRAYAAIHTQSASECTIWTSRPVTTRGSAAGCNGMKIRGSASHTVCTRTYVTPASRAPCTDCGRRRASVHVAARPLQARRAQQQQRRKRAEAMPAVQGEPPRAAWPAKTSQSMRQRRGVTPAGEPSGAARTGRALSRAYQARGRSKPRRARVPSPMPR
jgi:hypothetical protein